MKGGIDAAYTIIGGTSKAGTTSLFLYLADHPQVCASNSKETGFFLDDSYPRRAKYRLSDGASAYDHYFNQCPERPVRLDATPDYLYSDGAAARIAATLPGAHLIFILRDPVDRLVSWYRFAKQLGRLPADLTFDAYVQQQLEERPIQPGEQPTWRALQQGHYSHYLRAFYDSFPAHHLFVTSYGKLMTSPGALMDEVVGFIGLEDAVYQDYAFTVHNKTQAMRFPTINRTYVQGRDRLRMQLNTNPLAKAMLRPLRRGFEAVYFQVNRADEDKVFISDSLRRTLDSYYAGEREAIGALTGAGVFDWA